MGLFPSHAFSSKNGNKYYVSMNFMLLQTPSNSRDFKENFKLWHMILSVNYNLFYGRVYHDVPVTYIVGQTKKSAKNTLLSKIKVAIVKKLVIVRRRLIYYETLYAQQYSADFGYVLI